MNEKPHIKNLGFGKATTKTQQRIQEWFWYYPTKRGISYLQKGAREEFVLGAEKEPKWLVTDFAHLWTPTVLNVFKRQGQKWMCFIGLNQRFEIGKVFELGKKLRLYYHSYKPAKNLGFRLSHKVRYVLLFFATSNEQMSDVLMNYAKLLRGMLTELNLKPMPLFVQKYIKPVEVIKNAKQ